MNNFLETVGEYAMIAIGLVPLAAIGFIGYCIYIVAR